MSSSYDMFNNDYFNSITVSGDLKISEVPDVVVVYHRRTKKIVPFRYGDRGDIIIVAGYNYTEDELNVKLVKIDQVDFETGELL